MIALATAGAGTPLCRRRHGRPAGAAALAVRAADVLIAALAALYVGLAAVIVPNLSSARCAWAIRVESS